MITFINNSPDKPFVELRNRYMNALDNNQKSIEAVCISSYSNIKNEVTARFVNLKIVDTNQLIFLQTINQIRQVILKQTIKPQLQYFGIKLMYRLD